MSARLLGVVSFFGFYSVERTLCDVCVLAAARMRNTARDLHHQVTRVTHKAPLAFHSQMANRPPHV